MDNRLIQGSIAIATWPLCDVRLKNNANYPWILLIPRKEPAVTEICELDAPDRLLLMDEICRASAFIKQYYCPDKINIGALGNRVAQLHIHVIARFKHDALWPHSVWQSTLIETPYAEETLEKIMVDLKKILT